MNMTNQFKRADQIFISYRRDDSAGVTGRIYDRLAQKYGKEAIFKDVDSIPLGINFKQYIDSVVKECDLVIVIIGDRWIEETVEVGKRRLDDPRDFVRIEIESALQRNIPVIPLLVQQAVMPAEESLPPALKELAYRNGMAIGHDPYFHTDVDRLIKNLDNYFATLSKTTCQTSSQDIASKLSDSTSQLREEYPQATGRNSNSLNTAPVLPVQQPQLEKLLSSDSPNTDPRDSVSPAALLSSESEYKVEPSEQVMTNPIPGTCEVCGRKINWFDHRLGGVKRCKQHLKI